MKKDEINKLLNNFNQTKERNIVIIDYGNVQKWERSLGWKIGIKELGNLVKYFSQGKRFLRRFYYGSDFGKNDKSEILTEWSRMILEKAKMSGFEIVTKRVKYIIDNNYKTGFVKKCDMDIEMAIDLVKEARNYDNIILFSGDGDLAYVLKYLRQDRQKRVVVFGARGHIGRELYDAKSNGIVDNILYVEDFEYRLNMNRFKP